MRVQDGLERECYEKGIVYTVVNAEDHERAETLVRFFSTTEAANLRKAEVAVDKHIVRGGHKSAIVLDADKTLAPEDTTDMFWLYATKKANPVEAINSDWSGDTLAGYQQATLEYEKISEGTQLSLMCQAFEHQIAMYDEMVAFLHQAQK